MGEQERAPSDETNELACARSRADVAEAQLDRERDERDRLFQVVGHELRTPLSVLKGYVCLLATAEGGSLNEQQRRFLEQCEQGCQRMTRLIENLLESFRAGRDELPLQIETVCLVDSIRDLVCYFQPVLERRKVLLSFISEDRALPIACDRTRIDRLLTNLVDNSIQALETGGKIEIHCRRVRSADKGGAAMIEISVSDDGPGIPRIEHERIFDPFYRGEPAPSASGLGLGLSICRDIVSLHQGEIEVGDSHFGGARVTFRLPQSDVSKTDIQTEI